MRKKIFKMLAICFISILMLTNLFACQSKVVQLILNETDVVIKEGETYSLYVTIIPNDVNKVKVTWSSSNINVATVDYNGKVTGQSEGDCIITVECNGIVDNAKVKVKSKGPNFQAVYDEYCANKSWANVASDGSYLSIDTNPYDFDDYFDSNALQGVKDVNRALGLPDSLYNDMLYTTWSMGKQSETYEKLGIKVTWTYHPDKGLEIAYKILN